MCEHMGVSVLCLYIFPAVCFEARRRISGLPDIRISENLGIWISGFPDFRKSGYLDIRISGFPDIRISGYPDIRISGYPDFRISGFPDIRISGIPDIRISGNPDIRKSRISDIRNSGYPESRVYRYPVSRFFMIRKSPPIGLEILISDCGNFLLRVEWVYYFPSESNTIR